MGECSVAPAVELVSKRREHVREPISIHVDQASVAHRKSGLDSGSCVQCLKDGLRKGRDFGVFIDDSRSSPQRKTVGGCIGTYLVEHGGKRRRGRRRSHGLTVSHEQERNAEQ